MRTFAVIALLCAAAVSAPAETPEALFTRAQKLEQEGKISRAIEEYRVFLRNHRGHSKELEVYYRLAKCLDDQGLIDEAALLLQTATKSPENRFKNRPDALFLQGKLLGALGERESATKALELLLAEGAGLYEDEALNLCGSYYALDRKYTDAAAKFNILKRRTDSPFAERAAYKLAMVWLEAGDLDLAVEAVGDFAARWPANQEARGLLLRIADLFRQQRKYDQSIQVCTQLKTKFPRSPEGLSADYVAGLCYYDRKEFTKAEETLISVAGVPENMKSGLAAEAMMKAAAIRFQDLNDVQTAMSHYEKAAKLAEQYSVEDRKARILVLCYFRLAEYSFAERKWDIALKFYNLLRRLDTDVNVLQRILRCQAELGMNMGAGAQSAEEIELIRKKIAENPGTFIAAEGEVFLTDCEFGTLRRDTKAVAPFLKIVEKYEDIARRYPATVLAENHLASYIRFQIGLCLAHAYRMERQTAPDSETWKKAVAALEQAITVDKDTPYLFDALENMAEVADIAGQRRQSFLTYKRLYELAGEIYHKDEQNAGARARMTEYLRSMLTRADSAGNDLDAIALCKSIIEHEGIQSDAARYTFFYMADLYYLRQNFTNAAATYVEFVKTYGPKQGPDGNLADGPWQVRNPDWKTEQVFEAAVRIAHSWHRQDSNSNTLKAYAWLVRNFPNQNKYVAEARYWLAVQLADSDKAKQPEFKRKIADALWAGVISPKPLSDDAHKVPIHPGKQDVNRHRSDDFHFWVYDADMKRYVQPAAIKCGEILSELKEHEAAARAFAAYLKLYPSAGNRPATTDDYFAIALYALGREYVAMEQFEEMIDAYQPFLDGMRDCKLRISALRLMGYHLSTDELKEAGVKAYATILDEYGTNRKDEKGNIIPVPRDERIRQDNDGWDGIRLPPPDNLDLGQVRYALGHLYWKNEDWPSCVRALRPFIDYPELRKSESRAKALYMVAQCYYKSQDYKHGLDVLLNLVRTEPKFEAVQEVYVQAAAGCTELGLTEQMKELHKQFSSRHPASIHKPHMDLHNAVAILRDGDLDGGISRLKAIARSETYEDVKADAWYYLGMNEVTPGKGKSTGPLTPAHHKAALRYFELSMACLPQGKTCLAAAKSHMALGQWDEARTLLDRAVMEFPDSRKETIDEAKRLMPTVLREIAKKVK